MSTREHMFGIGNNKTEHEYLLAASKTLFEVKKRCLKIPLNTITECPPAPNVFKGHIKRVYEIARVNISPVQSY